MNKKAILLLFAMFGLPVVVATLMHSQWVDWQPTSTRNHGKLISPVIEWNADEVVAVGGASVDRQALQGKWHLVYHIRNQCDEACLESIYWLRQVRLAQDRHVPEIGLMVVHDLDMTEALVAQIREISQDFIIIAGDAASEVGGLFPTPDNGSSRYILDPMANIIMSYETEQVPDDIRKDLGRLLTWTKPTENY